MINYTTCAATMVPMPTQLVIVGELTHYQGDEYLRQLRDQVALLSLQE